MIYVRSRRRPGNSCDLSVGEDWGQGYPFESDSLLLQTNPNCNLDSEYGILHYWGYHYGESFTLHAVAHLKLQYVWISCM